MLTSHCGGRGSILNQSMEHFWQIGTEIRLCSEDRGFPLVLPYHHCSILILILKLLFIRTNGRILKIVTKFQSELYNMILLYHCSSVPKITHIKPSWALVSLHILFIELSLKFINVLGRNNQLTEILGVLYVLYTFI